MIAKNKGLTPKRKKEYRNPRVRNRMKFRKAKIRRKGQVREVVREIKRYDGEASGISANVVRSIKLK
ncbi:something about silencing protein 10 [Caerostris darwini]|uniref:Something about silencing protein 10 n=1 Tax=Caerostris darwini TaxID=1538125 RepID=A0AAV4U4G3_9ARAC|nr:something about silencing protein 10 [Caerostris darwini]